MVSAALIALIIGSVYAVLQAGMRYLVATNTCIGLQQQSLLATVWLTRELSESNPRTLAIFSNPNGILFGSPRDDAGDTWVDSSGAVRWPKFVCYYLEADASSGTQNLIRKAQYLDDPDLHTDPPPLLPPLPQPWQDLAYYQALEVPPRVVARSIQSLTFTGANPVAIELTVGATELGRTFQINLTSKVSLRN